MRGQWQRVTRTCHFPSLALVQKTAASKGRSHSHLLPPFWKRVREVTMTMRKTEMETEIVVEVEVEVEEERKRSTPSQVRGHHCSPVMH